MRVAGVRQRVLDVAEVVVEQRVALAEGRRVERHGLAQRGLLVGRRRRVPLHRVDAARMARGIEQEVMQVHQERAVELEAQRGRRRSGGPVGAAVEDARGQQDQDGEKRTR